MACLSPLIMTVCNFSFLNKKFADDDGVIRTNYFRIDRYKKLGWKINPDSMMGYKVACKDSTKLYLEGIPDWVTLKDIEVPCGNCIQCRLKYSKDWAVRCSLEAQEHQFNYFVTLSYDDDHIVKGKFGNGTLVPDHYTQFMKSLRQKMKRELGFVGVRMFGCGEYGDLSNRPHLHIILFNCPLPDLTVDFIDSEGQVSRHRNGLGQLMYYSQFIKDIWPYGNITVDDANYNTEAYVSRYILKKQKGQNSSIYSQKLGIVPPFIRMSLKPGIGEKYFSKNSSDLIDNPSIILQRSNKEPLVTGLPRYYMNKIKDGFTDDYEFMKKKAEENTLAIRSLLAGKQTINDNRKIKRERIEKEMDAFARDV